MGHCMKGLGRPEIPLTALLSRVFSKQPLNHLPDSEGLVDCLCLHTKLDMLDVNVYGIDSHFF